MTTPEKKPLLSRNELLVAAGFLVVGLAFAFLPLVDCAACGKDYRALQKDLQTARDKHSTPSVVALCQQALQDWNCDYCRGRGRASLMDRLVKGSPPPLPPPKSTSPGKPVVR